MTHTLSQLRSGELKGIKRLDLSCGLTEFPHEIFDLADSLEILNLTGNALTSLPPDLHRLHKLQVLFCSDNAFTELPEVLGDCHQLTMVGFKSNRIEHVPATALPSSLRWLILTNNCIEELPPTLGRCTSMQKLMLAGNRLRQLPESMIECRRLELLRIAANRLTALPDWLLTLPRLSWLAYADNPFCTADRPHGPSIPHVDWSKLHLHEKLGEGASGVIYRADWRHEPNILQPVAVKLFKGNMTSDGTPDSEMAASLAAGAQANLIDIKGQLAGHPEGARGLVMQLIDPVFRNLAGPPNLVSCTRDVYPDQLRLSLRTALRIALGIAAAMEHLHAAGILHGDLYAHNILWNGEGDCLLGDFGAASFFPATNQGRTQALQRIEVRAFGCLLEELIERCDGLGGDDLILQGLSRLQMECLQADVASRPLFAAILRILMALDFSDMFSS